MTSKKTDAIRKISGYLPSEITSVLSALDEELKDKLCEIRLKSDMPVVLIFTESQCYITKTGRITSFRSSELMVTDQKTINNIFSLMCGFSVYSYADKINNGFITLDGGIRVGVYGTAVTDNSTVYSVRNIRGLNVRIPVSVSGCSDKISELFHCGEIPNVIICGPPASGKTTVLKDLCRSLSDRLDIKTCVIDERFEFESEYLGIHTDVLSGYPKHSGIEIAVRTLSPQIVVLDEIGMNGETERIIECLNTGVSFVMSIHCTDKSDLYRKNQFVMLAEYGAVDYCVFLGNKSVVKEIISAEVLLNEAVRTDCIKPLSGNDRPVSFKLTEKTCGNSGKS